MTKESYASQLHWVGIVTLVILVAGLAALGWSLRPASGGFPAVQSPALYPSLRAGPQQYRVELTRTGDDGATMLVVNDRTSPDGPPWSLLINHLGSGRLCTPTGTIPVFGGGANYEVRPERLDRSPRHFATDTTGLGDAVAVEGRGTFYVELCWASDAPIETNGAYLSARMPLLRPYAVNEADAGPAAVTRELNLGSGNTADYSVQSEIHPTSVTTGGWQWSPKTPAESISFSAVNTSDTQHDSYQAFLSGIVFGVAGGALIALIQELVAPFRSRQELRPPEPGG